MEVHSYGQIDNHLRAELMFGSGLTHADFCYPPQYEAKILPKLNYLAEIGLKKGEMKFDRDLASQLFISSLRYGDVVEVYQTIEGQLVDGEGASLRVAKFNPNDGINDTGLIVVTGGVPTEFKYNSSEMPQKLKSTMDLLAHTFREVVQTAEHQWTGFGVRVCSILPTDQYVGVVQQEIDSIGQSSDSDYNKAKKLTELIREQISLFNHEPELFAGLTFDLVTGTAETSWLSSTLTFDQNGLELQQSRGESQYGKISEDTVIRKFVELALDPVKGNVLVIGGTLPMS